MRRTTAEKDVVQHVSHRLGMRGTTSRPSDRASNRDDRVGVTTDPHALTLVLRPRGAPSEHSREDMPPRFAWMSPEQPEQVRTNAVRDAIKRAFVTADTAKEAEEAAAGALDRPAQAWSGPPVRKGA